MDTALATNRNQGDTGVARERWTARDMPGQAGRTAVVTGANSGLGFLTSLELARRGAHVVMAVRDMDKGRRARHDIEATRPAGSVELRALDLSDLRQVAAFAAELLEDSRRIDLLVNNAGIMMPPRRLTAQGHELQFGVNHLAHFALTGLLLPRLLESADGRVVTVSSDLHRRGRIRFDDLSGSRRYRPLAFYAQSKLANVLFGLELDRRLRAAGMPVRSMLAHPGYAATNLQASGPRGLMVPFLRLGNRFLAQPAWMGVLPQLYAATDRRVQGGQFIGPDGRKGLRGYPTIVRPVEAAHDRELAARLWRLSEQLTGVEYPGPAQPARATPAPSSTCRA